MYANADPSAILYPLELCTGSPGALLEFRDTHTIPLSLCRIFFSTLFVPCVFVHVCVCVCVLQQHLADCQTLCTLPVVVWLVTLSLFHIHIPSFQKSCLVQALAAGCLLHCLG